MKIFGKDLEVSCNVQNEVYFGYIPIDEEDEPLPKIFMWMDTTRLCTTRRLLHPNR